MNNRKKAIDGERGAKGLIGIGGGLLLTAALKGISNSNKSNQIQKINSQIADIDRQINNYKSGLLGSWLNDTKIEELERKRSELVKERKKYE